jgi:3-deoxy-manno-octulosonate cytidylyltransferase (CMP-KDO synthetase)
LLYISRAAIPTTKALGYAGFARRQVGLYGFRKSALLAFSGHGGKTQLEALEDIEILRFLELGYAVTMIDVPAGGNAIDTPDDLVAANEFLKSF